MVKLRNKPEELEEIPGAGIRNLGGRTIQAEESPTGAEINPGDVFNAPEDWYNLRSHWHFLEVVNDPNVPTGTAETPPPIAPITDPPGTSPDVPDLDDMKKADLVALAESLGLDPSGMLKADLRNALAELLGVE